jgi:hypothetical protein
VLVQFAVMVVFPALSFWGSVYMLVQYWLDQDSWTLLRKRVMFANVPMCIFFGLVLAGQSEFHKMGMTCPQMAGILQVVYLMMNLWHTMTIITAYRFIILGRGRLVGFSRFLIHVVCWGFPIASTTAMYMLDNDVFHTDIFTDPDMVEAGGMAWCGVKSDKRVLKAIFVNTPQLVSVSLYAQYYSYIHEKVDPPEDTDPINKSTKLALSKNAALMGASAKRIAQYYQDVALQLRLYMTAYMLSFLTNTVIQLVGDNMALGPPSRANLIAQAIVVTPQGFLWALVYSRTAPNSLFEAYCNVAIKYFESKGNTPWAARFKGFRDGRATGQLAEKAAQLAADKAETDKATGMKCLGLTLGVWLQTFLMLPVGVWVWAPMGFLAEMMTSRFSVFLGLLVWGISTVFPFYWFRQGQVVCQSYADALESGSEYPKCEWFALIAQAFLIWVVGVSAFGVWKSRYLYHLNMIEGPVRRKGIFSSIGEGIRVNSVRNTMGIFTSVLEFYQTWGLTWQTGKMDDRYDPCLNPETIDEPCLEASGSAADFEEDGSMGDDGEEIQDSSAKNVRMYWLVVGMVGGWCFFYALPSVITTVSIKNRKASYNLTEAYRKYLWFMSGAGFLTILKALMLVLFCRPDPYEVSPCVFNATAVAEHKEASNETIGMGDPRVCSSGFAESNMTRLVPMTTNHMECWEPKHLQMVTISLLCLLIFFPSASLTCLFRYGDEDDRGCFKKADENGQFGEGSKPCVGGCLLGGEDCRWIHIWRRAEYMVKGVWVFSAYKFSSYSNYQEVNPGVIFLLAGSATITWLNFFMHPCNLSYFGRWKFLIHSCNTWTTITCLIVIGDNSRDKVAHFGMLYAGWAFIIGSQLIYEGWNFKTDVFRQEIGDEENIDKSKKDIASLKKSIINARSLKRWGVHSQITRLIRFAEHPDAPVQQEAFRAIASLAYNDQMTGGSMVPGTSNFMFITPVDPTVEAFLMTIEGRDRNGDPVTDLTTRNLATQCLLTFLQANVWNKYGALVSYYEAVEDYTMKAEADGRSVVQAFVAYIGECEDREHQIDALILLLNFCKVDTNHLVKVCDVALPLLQERIQSGELIEQFVAIQIISMVSERFDLAAKLIDTLIIKDVIDLFHMAMDQYKYNEMVDNGATKFEKSAGGGKCAPLTNSLTVPGHNLPIKLKELFIGEASRRNKEEFPEDLTLGEPELKKLMHQLMVNTISCVVECAGAVNHAGRRHLIDMGALAIMKRCFEFKDGATEDAGIIHDLQEEALRAAHAFMCGPFAERDIEVDPDFKMFDGMIMRFKEKAEASEPEPDFVGDGGLGADTKLTLEFDSTLTPLQRRKAHIMCEYHRLEHASIGVGIDRRVAAYAVTESLVKQDNPMDEKDDDVADIAAVPDMAEKPDYYSNDPQVNFDWNYEQVGKLDLDTKLLALQEANVNDPTGKVMFHVVDLMLLTLEHDMVPDHARDTYRTVMLDNISSPDVGMAVMGATGAEIFCVKDGVYAEYGERKEKYWPRGPLRMFKWAGRMVYWIWFWKIHSGSLGFLTPEEELAAKEEAEANDQETKFAEPALKQANPMDENME